MASFAGKASEDTVTTSNFPESDTRLPSAKSVIPPTPEKLQDALWKDGKSKYNTNVRKFQLTGGFDSTNYNEIVTKTCLQNLAISSVFLGMELGDRTYDKKTGDGPLRNPTTDLPNFVGDPNGIKREDHQGDGFLDTGIFCPSGYTLSTVEHKVVLYRKSDKTDWPTQTHITCATVNIGDSLNIRMCVSHMPGDGIELVPCVNPVPSSSGEGITVDYTAG